MPSKDLFYKAMLSFSFDPLILIIYQIIESLIITNIKVSSYAKTKYTLTPLS